MYAGDETSGVQQARATREAWPKPTERRPSIETIIEWSGEGEMEATDGCGGIEDDGTCPHGHPSWMLARGLI